MSKYAFLSFIAVLMIVSGCQSINVGGSGSAGGVRAGGGVSIPIPR